MEQFKTFQDVRAYLLTLEKWFARPIATGEHPTLHVSRGGDHIVCGIRREDYLFSMCGNWILPSIENGLSFSSNGQHLKGIYDLKSKRNPGKPVSVYWILEKADIPSGLEFHPDKRKKGHFLLCATTSMRAEELRAKLEWVADRMSIIRDAQVAL